MVTNPPSGRPERDETTTVKVRAALDGNRESLEWVVARFSPLLRAQALHRMGPRLAAQISPDDIVAEAWLVTLRRLEDLGEIERRATPRLLAFLGETIVRTINGHLKRTIRHGQVTPVMPMEEFPDEISGVVTRAVRNERRDALHDVLESLEEKDRVVVILRGIEGLSNDAAAEELDELPTTISHRYRRALEKLRRAMPSSIFDELLED